MQSQKRSNCNFDTHELIITKNECCSVYQLKKPKTILDSIKFINTNGILAVTGDYGNWIFCREFHPSEDGFVSDGYWLEKLEIASSQDGREFSSELSKKQILDCLEEEGITEEEKEWYESLLENIDDEFEYKNIAYNDKPLDIDWECIPYRKVTKYWLEVIFDGFDEICKRIKELNKNGGVVPIGEIK